MYIQKAGIKNIRSIADFEMTFPEHPAGWHALIWDKGGVKSSIVKGMVRLLN